MTAYCATYDKYFPDTSPCPHCKWMSDMQNANPSEIHWVSVPVGCLPTVCEFRGKWYWTDETENFGNYAPCDTREEAERQQEEYARHL